MEKSKAFKFHAQEVKHANKEVIHELNEGFEDVAALLNFKSPSRH